MSDERALLEVRGLCKYFGSAKRPVKAVDDVSFRIMPGETYGLVGESGSGKSTIGRTLIRVYDPTAGSIVFNGRDISGKLTPEAEFMLRTSMAMVFQDPMASLNPRKTVGDSIAEGLDVHHLCKTADEREERVLSMMRRVGLAEEFANRYPHQFSGGQRQRVNIARALVMNPKLIVADEAISALDVSIQAQVVNLLKDIQNETGAAILFIAHDLAMVRYISSRIGVLHLGHLVEQGSKEDIFERAIHPYTKGLLSAIPTPDPLRERGHRPLVYDYRTSGIDYGAGSVHAISATHTVLGTDEEVERWESGEWRELS